MKISAPSDINHAAALRRLKRKNGETGDFASLVEGQEETAPALEAAPPPALSSILALQEISDDELNRTKAIKRGKEALDTLDQLRLDLLAGRLPLARLRQMEKFVKENKSNELDADLRVTLEEIELRVTVELAKIEMSRKAP